MKKRTEITLETDRILIIRRAGRPVRAWCTGCSEEVAMITLEKAVALASTSTRTIYRWVEAGHVHFIETTDRAPLVCLNSLLGASATEDGQAGVNRDAAGIDSSP